MYIFDVHTQHVTAGAAHTAHDHQQGWSIDELFESQSQTAVLSLEIHSDLVVFGHTR
jgi:hypothetical protein